MEIVVLGRHSSSNVQKVLWTLNEIGVPYTREDYGGKFGRTQGAEYLHLNPSGTIPTVIDGDFVIWESNTVCRYLANKYGATDLYPPDTRDRALCERWMDWTLGSLHPALVPLYAMLVRTPEAARDRAAIENMREKCMKLFSVLDDALEEGGFLTGRTLTLADIAIGPWLHRWMALKLAVPEQARLARWYTRLAQRKAYQQGVMAAALE
jgi:glutathione S-transferase